MRDSVLLSPGPRLGIVGVWDVIPRAVTCCERPVQKIVAEQGTADHHQGEDGDYHEPDEEDGQQAMPGGDLC